MYWKKRPIKVNLDEFPPVVVLEFGNYRVVEDWYPEDGSAEKLISLKSE